jgi:hypothetical protein
MAKTFYVNCPCCKALMEISSETGEILQKWAPGQNDNTDQDKMSAALKKMEDAKKKRAGLFDQKRGELEGQKKKVQDDFSKEVDRVKKEGVTKNPLRPFDLD